MGQQVSDETLTLWTVEFRSFASWDYSTPLMYIAVQCTRVRAATEDDAKGEVLAWATPGGHIKIISCERAPEWMQ